MAGDFNFFYLPWLLFLQRVDGARLESNLGDVALCILQSNCFECIIIENASVRLGFDIIKCGGDDLCCD